MRQPPRIARDLSLVVALALALPAPVALAAPPRPKKAAAKPKKKAPKPGEPAAEPEKAPEPEPKKATAPEPVPAPTPVPEAPQPEPVAAKPVEPAVVPISSGPTESALTDEDAALGKKEAARIAAGRAQVAVSASVDVGRRHFAYSDPVGNGYAPYRLPAAPMLSFGAEVYPAAASGVPLLRDLGLRGRVSRGFAFDSNTPQGVTLETSWTRFGGELRQRLLWPGPHAFELGILAGADASYFGMTAKGTVPALLPAARTVSLRFGLDAQLRVVSRLSLALGGAYLLPTSKGEIYEHFHKPKLGGIDGHAAIVVGLLPGLEARLSGRYTRYFAKFSPQLGDRYVAGGALDEQMQFGLGVRYAH